ncbi:MAG TPA: P-type conjugative transfer protein TrbL [Candidatus Accumulibacter sp.]|jgi:type IV secretion system protein TrbL|nr:P-type conjugative transfer protein TrbL [Accumulibacter sp.]
MKGIKTAALIGAALMLYSVGAAAQLTNQGMLDQVVTEFATRASSWQSVVMNAALWLFWTLGTISLVWTGGILILRKADIGEFLAEFVRFILFFGFFLWLLRNGPAFASSIIRSLQKLGEQASGVSSVTPSSIVDIGFMIWKQAIISLSLWTPIDSFVGIALSAGIMLLLAAVAVNMLLLLVAGWILMYAGIFFLGFGGSRWTSDLAINYYKAVLGVAVQLMAMVLLIGIGNDLLSTFYAKMNKGALNFEELGVMLVFCFALLMLINRVPSLLAGVITGSGSGGAGNFGAGAIAGAAMGAAGMAAAATSMAGAAVMGGVQNIAGGAQALMAACSKASQDVAGGSDMLANLGGGSSSDSGRSSGVGSASPLAAAMDTGSVSGRSFGGGTSHAGKSDARQATPRQGGTPGQAQSGGMVSAVAKVGKVAAGTAANLAQGTWDVAKTKTGEMKDAAMDRISETTGGKIAAAIKARSNQKPAFGSDSLARAEDKSVDAESEVAAFRDRAARSS